MRWSARGVPRACRDDRVRGRLDGVRRRAPAATTYGMAGHACGETSGFGERASDLLLNLESSDVAAAMRRRREHAADAEIARETCVIGAHRGDIANEAAVCSKTQEPLRLVAIDRLLLVERPDALKGPTAHGEVRAVDEIDVAVGGSVVEMGDRESLASAPSRVARLEDDLDRAAIALGARRHGDARLERGEPMGLEAAVVVDKDDHIAARGCDTRVACTIGSPLPFTANVAKGDPTRPGARLHQLARFAVERVVRNDNFARLPRLLPDEIIENTIEVPSAASARRDDDREAHIEQYRPTSPIHQLARLVADREDAQAEALGAAAAGACTADLQAVVTRAFELERRRFDTLLAWYALRRLPLRGWRRVLVVDAGAGDEVIFLLERGYDVEAIRPSDVRAGALVEERLRRRRLSLTWVDHPRARRFDAVFAFTPAPGRAAIERLADALRPGGFMAAVSVSDRIAASVRPLRRETPDGELGDVADVAVFRRRRDVADLVPVLRRRVARDEMEESLAGAGDVEVDDSTVPGGTG